MANEEEWRKNSYEEWVGRQGNNSIGTNANRAGYDEYLREQKRKEEHHNAMMQASKNQQSSCWVATAYYGSIDHPRVNALRELRNSLIEQKLIGRFVNKVNILYHKTGKSCFGNWWASKLIYTGNFSLPRLATRIPLMILQLFTKK